MSHIEVNILHQAYVLTCPQGQESQLREAAERVDTQFQRIRNSSKLRSREHVGVLLAVNLAYENLELRNQLQALQLQIAALQSANSAEDDVLPCSDLQGYDIATAHALIARLDAALTKPSCAPTDAPLQVQISHLEVQDAIAVGAPELPPAIAAPMPSAASAPVLSAMDANTMTSGNDNPAILPTTLGEAR